MVVRKLPNPKTYNIDSVWPYYANQGLKKHFFSFTYVDEGIILKLVESLIKSIKEGTPYLLQ